MSHYVKRAKGQGHRDSKVSGTKCNVTFWTNSHYNLQTWSKCCPTKCHVYRTCTVTRSNSRSRSNCILHTANALDLLTSSNVVCEQFSGVFFVTSPITHHAVVLYIDCVIW